MKILVTGHRGFIGKCMYLSLKAQGHDVEGYEYGDAFPGVKGLDWIMHIGAISSTTERDVDKVMRQNYDFSINLYQEAVEHEINFQFSSSASVYGLNREFKEDSPVDPRTPYAWSKYMVERHIQNNPSTAIAQVFRYFNVYGPEGEEHKGNQASPHFKFKYQADTHGEVEVFKDSQRYLRDFIHVGDVIGTQQKFFYIPESGIYNLGTGKVSSFLDVANMYSSKIVEVPMPEVLKSNYQEYTCADMSKTLRMLRKYHI